MGQETDPKDSMTMAGYGEKAKWWRIKAATGFQILTPGGSGGKLEWQPPPPAPWLPQVETHCFTAPPGYHSRSFAPSLRPWWGVIHTTVKPQGRMNHCSLERAQQSPGRLLQPSPSEKHPRGTHNKLHTWQQPGLVLVLSGLHRAEKDAWSWWTCFHPASPWGHKMFPRRNSWDRCS